MVCECLPFDSESEKKTIEATCKDNLLFDSLQWQTFPLQGIKLIEKLLCKDPERRITIDKVLDDPWFYKLKSQGKIPARNKVSRNGSLHMRFAS